MTATSQIINDWRYPGGMVFDANEHIHQFQGEVGLMAIDGDAASPSLPMFAQLNTALASIHYDPDLTEETCLFFVAGVKIQTNNGRQSGADMLRTERAYNDTEDFQHGSARPDHGSDVWGRQRARVK